MTEDSISSAGTTNSMVWVSAAGPFPETFPKAIGRADE